MPTRREVLLSLISGPLAVSLASPATEFNSEPEIRAEPHCLSQESALGFGRLLKNGARVRSGIIILPAARDLSAQSYSELRRRMIAGAWLIYESGLCFSSYEESLYQCRVLKAVFGLDALPPLSSSGSYVAYTWPLPRLVRSFQAITPVRCASNETVARFNGIPVCARRAVGKGGIIYLGSMLGPGLFAEEREAHVVADAMLRGYSDL